MASVFKINTAGLPNLSDESLTHINKLVFQNPQTEDAARQPFTSAIRLQTGSPGDHAIIRTIAHFYLRQILFRDGQIYLYGTDHSSGVAGGPTGC